MSLMRKLFPQDKELANTREKAEAAKQEAETQLREIEQRLTILQTRLEVITRNDKNRRG